MPVSSDFSYEQIPPVGDSTEEDPGTWRVKLADGTEFAWTGFYTGPATLGQEELSKISLQLLGLDLEDVPQAAELELRPYVSDGSPVHSVILHSATPVLKSLRADMDDALNGRPADDVAAYVETRSVALAGSHDLVVGRTSTWRAAAQLASVEMVEIPGIEYYYLTHAILRLAADQGVSSPAIARLVRDLQAQPGTLVRLYALDRETQMVLLYLKRAAGLEVLHTDANSPEVAEYWNTKAPLHPTAEVAVKAEAGSDLPQVTLAAETALSSLARRLNVSCTVFPGYTVDGNAPTQEVATERLLAAAELLGHRYGITHGCLKPSEGGAGARIIPGIDLSDSAQLRRLAERIFTAREQFILEAHVSYVSKEVGGQKIMLSPSVHIRHGHPAPGMTVQLTNGTSWQGNVYVDERACGAVGITLDQYRHIRSALEALHRGFASVQLDVVTAGFDFGIGRVGGQFSDEVMVALQDPNLSSHGAEYLRLFLDDVAARGGPAYGATKVVIPVASLAALTKSAEDAATSRWSRVMSAIPGRWGMLAVAAESPDAAIHLISDWEQKWIASGLIKPAAFR